MLQRYIIYRGMLIQSFRQNLCVNIPDNMNYIQTHTVRITTMVLEIFLNMSVVHKRLCSPVIRANRLSQRLCISYKYMIIFSCFRFPIVAFQYYQYRREVLLISMMFSFGCYDTAHIEVKSIGHSTYYIIFLKRSLPNYGYFCLSINM